MEPIINVEKVQDDTKGRVTPNVMLTDRAILNKHLPIP
jgi:hypothetical protein